jgi:hypothetical protein
MMFKNISHATLEVSGSPCQHALLTLPSPSLARAQGGDATLTLLDRDRMFGKDLFANLFFSFPATFLQTCGKR